MESIDYTDYQLLEIATKIRAKIFLLSQIREVF
jgi:hypothetical protein